MQDNKKDKTLPFEIDDSLDNAYPLKLPKDIAEQIKQGLLLEELINISRISKTNYLYFKPFLSTLVSFAADLFDWAKSLKPDDFSKYVVDIIDKHYVLASPNFSEKPIRGYLNASLKDSSDTRLAYILSSSAVTTGMLLCT